MDTKLVLVLALWVVVARCGEMHIPLDYIVPYGTPATYFNKSAPVKGPFTFEELQRCERLIGRVMNDVFVGEEQQYDVAQLLLDLGGAPGLVNATRRINVPEAPLEDADIEQGPPADVPEEYWLYNYKATDYVSYYRHEHAVRRFPGTPKEYLDVRGTLAWTPPDFCGKMRRADYRQDNSGFEAQTGRYHCRFSGAMICSPIPICRDYAFEGGSLVNCIV